MHLPITVPVFMHLSSSGGRGAGADQSSRTVAAPAFANMAALEFSIGRYLCSALKCSWMAAHEFANGGPRAQLRCSWTAAAPTFVDAAALEFAEWRSLCSALWFVLNELKTFARGLEPDTLTTLSRKSSLSCSHYCTSLCASSNESTRARGSRS